MYRISSLRNAVTRIKTVRSLTSTVAGLKEPNEPRIITQQIPGPQALDLKEQLGKLQQSSGVVLFVDYEKSVGKLVRGW